MSKDEFLDTEAYAQCFKALFEQVTSHIKLANH